jgi:hypothetical protein
LYFRFCEFVVPDTDDDHVHGQGEDVSDDPQEGQKNPAAAVVFFSNIGLNVMKTSTEINIDGTFTTIPSPFKQILFVQAKQPGGKRAVPVLFALLTKKVLGSSVTYFREFKGKAF